MCHTTAHGIFQSKVNIDTFSESFDHQQPRGEWIRTLQWCSTSQPADMLRSRRRCQPNESLPRRWPITRFQFLHNCASKRTYRHTIQTYSASAVLSGWTEITVLVVIVVVECSETLWIQRIIYGQCLSDFSVQWYKGKNDSALIDEFQHFMVITFEVLSTRKMLRVW